MASSPFSADTEIVLLNAPTLDAQGNKDVFFGKRTGTLASGKARKPRYTVEIRSQPILMDLDELALGQQSAEAIQGLLRDQTRNISVKAQPATLANRARMAVEFAAGHRHALERYSGGRTGPMPPNQKDTLFNDSGRFAEGIHVRLNHKDNTFTVNLPANRDFAQDVAMFDRWRRLVPASDPNKLAQYKVVSDAISRSVKEMIEKVPSVDAAKLKVLEATRRRAIRALARAALELATS